MAERVGFGHWYFSAEKSIDPASRYPRSGFQIFFYQIKPNLAMPASV